MTTEPPSSRSGEDLVRAVLARRAPDELPHLGAVTALSVEDPSAMDVNRERSEALGMGVAVPLAVLAPLLYGVLIELASGAIAGGLRTMWRRVGRRRRGPIFDPRAAVGTYTPEQILHAKSSLSRRLLAKGFKAADAAAIAEDFATELAACR